MKFFKRKDEHAHEQTLAETLQAVLLRLASVEGKVGSLEIWVQEVNDGLYRRKSSDSAKKYREVEETLMDSLIKSLRPSEDTEKI